MGINNRDTIFSNINIYLISSIPLILLARSFLSNTLVILICLFFLFTIFKKKEFHYFKHPLAIFFYIWSVYLILRSLFSENPLLSLESSLFYWRYIIFSIAIWYTLENYSRTLKYFFYVLSLCFISLIIDGFIQYYTGTNLLGTAYDNSEGYRISSFFGDELILGSYFSRLFPLFFGLAILMEKHSRFFLYFAIFIFIFVDILIYLSGERTALFYLFLTTLILLIFLSKWKLLRIATIFISLSVIILIGLFDIESKKRVLNKTFSQIIEGETINLFTVQHGIIYKSGYKIFLDYPIFGIGPKLFREKCKEKKYLIYDERSKVDTGCQTSPHNSYLQILVELGLVGFIFILTLFFYLIFLFSKHLYFKIIKRKKFMTDFQICMCAAVLITLWPIAPSGNFFGSYINIFYFLPIGFLMYGFKNKI